MTRCGEESGTEKGSLPLSRGMHQNPALSNVIVLKQLLNFIPPSFLNQIERKTSVDFKALALSILSQVAGLMLSSPLRTREIQAAWQPQASIRETHLR
jgi:hypothetical protein